MSCTSPLYRVPCSSFNFGLLTGKDQERKKNHGVFLTYDAVKAYEANPLWIRDAVQKLRCGQCTDCRLAYSRDWAVRCSLEAERHEFNYFVTLTYDDLHIPHNSDGFVDYNGDVFDTNLCRRDVQLFLKNLREWERTHNNNTGIKVFYCGEYGGLTNRPHYHLCLFGVSRIPDLSFFRKKGSFTYYKSVKYEHFWDHRGFVDISEVSFDSIAYTARYCLKKQRGLMKKDFLDFYNTLSDPLPLRTQPFIGMSLKPGIASEYWSENKEQIKLEDLVKYQKKFELFKSKPPRYFDKLFDAEDPDGFEKLKKSRLKTALASQGAKRTLVLESEAERQAHEAVINNSKENRRYVRGL